MQTWILMSVQVIWIQLGNQSSRVQSNAHMAGALHNDNYMHLTRNTSPSVGGHPKPWHRLPPLIKYQQNTRSTASDVVVLLPSITCNCNCGNNNHNIINRRLMNVRPRAQWPANIGTYKHTHMPAGLRNYLIKAHRFGSERAIQSQQRMA